MEFTREECIEWLGNKGKNPRTGRKISSSSKNGIYSQLEAQSIKYGLIQKTYIPPRQISWKERIFGCKPKIDRGPVVYTKNVSRVQDEEIESLGEFSLSGLETKIKVTRVIDGDTVIGVFYVSFGFLTEKQDLIEERIHIRKCMILSLPRGKGFYIKKRCRLLGVDAAEHDTIHGCEASKLLLNIINQNNCVVYGRFSGEEKYGRALVEFYLDRDMRTSITEILVNYNHPTLGKIAEPYSGGTKSDYMKNLPKTKDKKALRAYVVPDWKRRDYESLISQYL